MKQLRDENFEWAVASIVNDMGDSCPGAEMRKFLLVPGCVASTTDMDTHYIGVGDLCHLYGVHMRDCDVIKQEDPEFSVRHQIAIERGQTVLAPRRNGDYSLVRKMRERGEFDAKD